jgi:exodeoxyribonuclease VII large subunit
LRSQLRALSPQATLDRGYAIVQNSAGHVVTSPAEAPAGTGIRVTLARGALAATAGDAVPSAAGPGPDADTDAEPAASQRGK